MTTRMNGHSATIVKGKRFLIPALVGRDGRIFVDAVVPEVPVENAAGSIELEGRIPDEMRTSDTAEIRIEVDMDFELLFMTRVMSAKLSPVPIEAVMKEYQELYRELYGKTPEWRSSGTGWVYVEGMSEDGKAIRRREVEGRSAQMRNELARRRAGEE